MHISQLPDKASYVNAWRRAKTCPDVTFGPWPPRTGAEWVRDFRRALDARINDRGGLSRRDFDPENRPDIDRVRRHLARTVRCECRWCGTPIPYAPTHQRFCSPGCRRDYWG